MKDDIYFEWGVDGKHWAENGCAGRYLVRMFATERDMARSNFKGAKKISQQKYRKTKKGNLKKIRD
jgi:hypothetical protein